MARSRRRRCKRRRWKLVIIGQQSDEQRMVPGVEIYKEGFGPLGVWMWRLKGAQSPLPKMSSEHLSQEPHG